MIYISHRGNINGENPERENSPEYISEALNNGYDVEVDIWFINNKWYFGHDEPKYEIDLENFKFSFNKLWLHCKNLEALTKLYEYQSSLIYFWHQHDSFTLTSNNYIWTFPDNKLSNKSICVLPEIPISNLHNRYTEKDFNNCAGICSDYIEKYKLKFLSYPN
jgi:hypothetical protein